MPPSAVFYYLFKSKRCCPVYGIAYSGKTKTVSYCADGDRFCILICSLIIPMPKVASFCIGKNCPPDTVIVESVMTAGAVRRPTIVNCDCFSEA